MKALAAIIASLSAAAISLGATFETDAALSGNMRSDEHNNYVVKNTGKESGQLVLDFDLSGCPLGNAPQFAAIYMQAFSPDEKLAHGGLTLSLDGRDISGAAVHIGHSEVYFPITREIQKAFAKGKKKLTFTVRQNGGADAQNTVVPGYVKLFISDDKHYELGEYMRPVWKAGKMTDESIFFIGGENGEPAKGSLFFKPKKIISARSYGTGKELKEGVDFKVDGENITLTKNTEAVWMPYNLIYNSDPEKLHKPGGNFPTTRPGVFMFFTEGDWFHKHDTYFTYEHGGEGWESERFGEKLDAKKLPKTIAKLKKGESVRITLYGDSITENANASARAKCPPLTVSWGDLAAEALRAKYKKADIAVFNRALGGKTLGWGMENAEGLAAPDKSDLYIIAFGMNDGCPGRERSEGLEFIMKKAREQNPDAEFIIVTPMTANPLWFVSAAHDSYEESDRQMEREGVAVANVRAAHKELQKKKPFIDMTGNNANHPNDFLIRVYAQVVASKLMQLK